MGSDNKRIFPKGKKKKKEKKGGEEKVTYYYIVDKTTKTAECFGNLRSAKKSALEKKSLIYTNKKQLPEWVETVYGFCHTTLKRLNGKFAKKMCVKYFNEDMGA